MFIKLLKRCLFYILRDDIPCSDMKWEESKQFEEDIKTVDMKVKKYFQLELTMDPNPNSKKPGNDARTFFQADNLEKVVGAFQLIECHREEQRNRKADFTSNYRRVIVSFQAIRLCYKYQDFSKPPPVKEDYQRRAVEFGNLLFRTFPFLPCPNTLHAFIDHSYFWIPELATLSAEPLETGHKELRDIMLRKSWKGDAHQSLNDALILQFITSSPKLQR